MTASAAPASQTPEELFAAVCDHARRVAVLASVEALLGWDEQTSLPPEAGSYRGEQAAAVAGIVHRLRTDPAHGDRIAQLAAGPLAHSGPAVVAGTIRLLERDFTKQARLPARLVEELAKTSIEAQQAWRAAREASSWAAFAPWLERMFALKREQAACQLPDHDPYDALMDDYEPGASWPAIAARFDRLRGQIVPLVRACVDAPQRPDDGLLRRACPVADQRLFVRRVAERIGFDFQRGRLDTAAHPFCSTMGPDDCRITTRWDEHFFPTALYGVLHEAGHGLYEQGLPRDWHGLPPGEAASLGIHESQSRLWENLVGRSPAFWEWCFPLARDAFPGALAGTTADEVQRALMTVTPSFIRVEADEVTYNLHIVLRYELELELIRGNLQAAELEHAWNEKTKALLGLEVKSVGQGVLQDIHWAYGEFGYFPTYSLGNLYSASLWNAATRANPGLEKSISEGELAPLKRWLNEQVHREGFRTDAESLVTKITGRGLTDEDFVGYLKSKYTPLYGL